jgi:hypothetical protein
MVIQVRLVTILLQAFVGGLAGLRAHLPRLIASRWIMALTAWGILIASTYIVYPEYHVAPSSWPAHMAWFSPLLATAVALP